MVAPFRRSAEPAAVTRTPEQEAEHEVAVAIQGQYRRRIGETLEIVNAAGTVETVRIQNINAGDDHAEVIIVHANKRIETIPAVTLAEQETLAAERAATATGGASRVIRLGNAPEVTDIAGSTKKKFKMRYGAVDVSDAVEERARDSAEETLHREKAELAGISGFIAKIWKHNVAYEIYRQVGIARARNKILTDKNLYTNEGLQKADHTRAVMAVVDRFVEEHQNSLHQQGADGERIKKMGDSSPAEIIVKKKLNALIREYAANPAMDEDEVNKRRISIYREANDLAGEAKGRGVMVADNMIEIAKAVREHALHAGGIDNLDIDLEYIVGKAKMGARTEQEKSAIDKALEGMDRLTSKHGITAGIWGATRSGVAVAGAIGLTMAQMMARSNVAKLATFGGSALATGLFSWWREKGRTNREHALHERQRALGAALRSEQSVEELNAEEIQLNRQLAATKWWQPVDRANLRARIDKVRDTKQPRREKMDEFALHRLNARDLSDRGQAFLAPDGKLKPGLDPADAMRALADMEARVSIGNIEKKDLLQYSGVAEVEIERRDLDETRMVLKAALRAVNANFEADYDGIYNGVVGVITDHKNTQQKKFNEYAKQRAKNAALVAVGSGMAVGFMAHEVWELANGGDGLSMLRGVGTFQQWLMSYLDHTPVAPDLSTGAPELHTFADGAISTPPGTELLQQADGSWSLQAMADHRVIADGLHIGSNGSLDAASVNALENLGGTVAQQDVMTDSVNTITEKVGIWDWLRAHTPSVTKVYRDIWMGNDTPAPVFDFNEQGLHWGQTTGDSYTMSLSSMTHGGSWQNGLHIDPLQETANGNMRLVLTLSEGSQNHAITLTPDADGNFTIPMNSDIGRTLFTTDQSVIDAALAANPRLHHVAGEPFFLGYHAEIAMSRGIDDAGVEHLAILATHTGSGLDHGVITRDIGECVEKHLTEIRLPSSATDPNALPPIVLPPILPIRARTPMERLATRKPGPRVTPIGPAEPTAGGIEMYPYYPNTTEGDWDQLRADMSPRLQANPDARLNPRTESEWYFADMERRYPGYREELDALDHQNNTAMGANVEAAVALAVAGAGEQANIYRTLETYAVQKDRNGKSVWTGADHKFEILLYVNWPKGADASKTLKEIARFQKDHPEVVVNTYTEEIKSSKVEVGWIKRKVFDLALRRNLRRPGDKDILIIANDADTVYSSAHYLTDATETMEKHPDYDAVLGRQDLDPEVYEKNPTFHVAMRFAQFIEAISRSKTGHIMTQGRNTVLRGSSYAAVGGNRTRDFWADIEFGKLFSAARNGKKSTGFSNKAWVMVDPRREIDKFKSGELLAYTWSDFNDRKNVRGGGRAEHAQPENMDVKRLAEADESDPLVQQFNARVRDEIEAFVDIAKKTFYYTGTGQLGSEGQRYVNRALDFLGIKANVSLSPEKVEIITTDTSKLRRFLFEYREGNRKNAKLKNNPLGPFIPPTL